MNNQRGQLAECMRCGERGLAKNLIKDGRNPQLLVLTTCGCYDAEHLSEQPFAPKSAEGKARFPVSPELLPAIEIALEVVAGSGSLAWLLGAWDEDAWDEDAWTSGEGAVLSWNRPTTEGARLEEYEVWRDAGNGFARIATNEIEYSDYMGVLNSPEEYLDDTAVDAGTYRFYVEGVTGNGRRYRSNTVTLEVVEA